MISRVMWWLEGVLRALFAAEAPGRPSKRSGDELGPQVFRCPRRYQSALQAAHREAEDLD